MCYFCEICIPNEGSLLPLFFTSITRIFLVTFSGPIFPVSLYNSGTFLNFSFLLFLRHLQVTVSQNFLMNHFLLKWQKNWHQSAPNSNKLLQTAPICAKVQYTNFHQSAPSCTKLHQVVPNWTNLNQVRPVCTKLHQTAPILTKLH